MRRFFLILSAILFSILSVPLLENSSANAWNQQYFVPNCGTTGQYLTIRQNIEANLVDHLKANGVTPMFDSQLLVFSRTSNFQQIPHEWGFVYNATEDIILDLNAGQRGIRRPVGTYTGYSTNEGVTWSFLGPTTEVSWIYPEGTQSRGCMMYRNGVTRPSWLAADVPALDLRLYDEALQIQPEGEAEICWSNLGSGNCNSEGVKKYTTFEIGQILGGSLPEGTESTSVTYTGHGGATCNASHLRFLGSKATTTIAVQTNSTNVLGQSTRTVEVYFHLENEQTQLFWIPASPAYPKGAVAVSSDKPDVDVFRATIRQQAQLGTGNRWFNIFCEEGQINDYLVSNPNSSGYSSWQRKFISSEGVVPLDPNYPPGYLGPELPESGFFKTEYTPTIGYTLTTDYNLTAHHYNADIKIPTNLGGELVPKLRWTLYDPDKETVLNTQVTDILSPYSYTFPGIDIYYLKVEYIHPGPPAAAFADNVQLVPIEFKLNVNGVFVVGSSDLNSCTLQTGVLVCDEASPLKDCSEFNTIVEIFDTELEFVSAETFSCLADNFGTWLKVTLIDLFAPSYSFFNNWSTDFQSFWEDKLGFVYQSLDTTVVLFQNTVDSSVTTKCSISPPGEFYGSSFDLDVCVFEDMYPAGFTAIRALMIAITLVGLSFAGYRKYMSVTRTS